MIELTNFIYDGCWWFRKQLAQFNLKHLHKHSTGHYILEMEDRGRKSNLFIRPKCFLSQALCYNYMLGFERKSWTASLFLRIFMVIINSTSHLDVESADLWAPPDHRDERSHKYSDPAAPTVSNKQKSMHQFEVGKPASSILNVKTNNLLKCCETNQHKLNPKKSLAEGEI